MHQTIVKVLYTTTYKLPHIVHSFFFSAKAVIEYTMFQECARGLGYKNMSDVMFALKEYSNKG